MEDNLISKVHNDFKQMSFNQKIFFLKDYKQTIELLHLHINHAVETKYSGIKINLINDIIKNSPDEDIKVLRRYYSKVWNTDLFSTFDLKFIIILAKVLDYKELTEKTYKMLVFAQKHVLWRDSAALGLTKNHFRFYWLNTQHQASIKRMLRFNESWIQDIDVICDIYSFLQHIVNYHPTFPTTYSSLLANDNTKLDDYKFDGIKLDPDKFNIII